MLYAAALGTGELLVSITTETQTLAEPEVAAPQMAEPEVAAPEDITADKVTAAAVEVAQVATRPQVGPDALEDLFGKLFVMADSVAAARQTDPQSTARAEILDETAAVINSLIDRLASATLRD